MKKLSLAIVAIMLVAIIGFTLVACTAVSAEKAEKNLKANGYEVVVETKIAGLTDVEGLEKVIIATKLTKGGTFLYFEKASQAKKFYNEHKDEIKDSNVKVSGKLVYAISSEEVLKDAKKS